MPQSSWRTLMPCTADELWAWHERPGALDRLLPPWQQIELLVRNRGIATGARTEFEILKGPFRQRWVAVHSDHEQGRMFTDIALESPFSKWTHVHRFEPDPEGAWLDDRVAYDLPLGPLGRLGEGYVAAELERMFRFRHRRTLDDLRRHQGRERKCFAVTGASGRLGRELVAFLTTGGHNVRRMVRRPPTTPDEIFWNPKAGTIDADALVGVDAVIHLAGADVAGGRWTEERKRDIKESRVAPTRLLAETLAKMKLPPTALVCASGVGIYGNRGEETLDESSARGDGFLSEVAEGWEQASQSAQEAGIRVVNLRLGAVVSARGGMLSKLVPPFSMGLGGPVGDGQGWTPWISMDDAIGAFYFACLESNLSGAVNAVAPGEIRNAELSKVLGRVLHRPAFIPVPTFALKAALGEMAELVLDSTRASAGKLVNSGYQFLYPDFEAAVRHELGRE